MTLWHIWILADYNFSWSLYVLLAIHVVLLHQIYYTHTVGSDRGRQAGRGSNPNVLENTDSFASDPIGGTNIRRSLKHGRARSKKKYAGGV